MDRLAQFAKLPGVALRTHPRRLESLAVAWEWQISLTDDDKILLALLPADRDLFLRLGKIPQHSLPTSAAEELGAQCRDREGRIGKLRSVRQGPDRVGPVTEEVPVE